MRIPILNVVTIGFLAALLCSCVSYPGAMGVSGRYVNPQTGGFVTFYSNGKFYYSLIAPASSGGDGRLGYYSFGKAGDDKPLLTVASAHAGLFDLRFSDSRDRIFVTAPTLFPEERVYAKVGNPFSD